MHCSLDLYWCESEPTQQAVAALLQLPHLVLSLGIHSYFGTEATAVPSEYPDAEFYDLTELPPMAGLHLTELRLLGEVAPPPDLLKLKHLCLLELNSLLGSVPWGKESWSSLAVLTRLKVINSNLPGAPAGMWDCLAVGTCERTAPAHQLCSRGFAMQMLPRWLLPPAWPRCTPQAAQTPGVPCWRRCAPTFSSRLPRQHRLGGNCPCMHRQWHAIDLTDTRQLHHKATISTFPADPALAVPAMAHAALVKFLPACCLVCVHALPFVAQSLCSVMPRARFDGRGTGREERQH